MTAEAPERDAALRKKRRAFNIIAVIGIALFAIYVAFITVTVMVGKKPEPKQGASPSRVLVGTQAENLRFSDDGAYVEFDLVRTYRLTMQDDLTVGSTVREAERRRVATSRIARKKPDPLRDRARLMIQRLLSFSGIVRADNAALAFSPDGLEIAFVRPGEDASVLYRNWDGHYRNLTGLLTEPLEQVNESNRKRRKLEEKLALESRLLWGDAAIESTLKLGPRAVVAADRLVRPAEPADEEIAFLVRLISDFDLPDRIAQAARVLHERAGNDKICSQLIQGLEDDPMSVQKVRVELLQALTERDFSRKFPCPSLRSWVVRASFQNGTFSRLDPKLKSKALEIQKRFVTRDDIRELGSLIERGVEPVACAILIAHAGEVEEEFDLLKTHPEDARQWWQEHRQRWQ